MDTPSPFSASTATGKARDVVVQFSGPRKEPGRPVLSPEYFRPFFGAGAPNWPMPRARMDSTAGRQTSICGSVRNRSLGEWRPVNGRGPAGRPFFRSVVPPPPRQGSLSRESQFFPGNPKGDKGRGTPGQVPRPPLHADPNVSSRCADGQVASGAWATQSFSKATQSFSGATQSFSKATQSFSKATQSFSGATQSFSKATQSFSGVSQKLKPNSLVGHSLSEVSPGQRRSQAPGRPDPDSRGQQRLRRHANTAPPTTPPDIPRFGDGATNGMPSSLATSDASPTDRATSREGPCPSSNYNRPRGSHRNSTVVSAPQSSSVAAPPGIRGAPAANGQFPLALHVTIQKTRLCVYLTKGKPCPRPDCSFAHSPTELRQRPDLLRTKLCRSFTDFGTCDNGDNCRFAHGISELRHTKEFYKTALCAVWRAQGSCKAGERCRFAHGAGDLRPVQLGNSGAQFSGRADPSPCHFNGGKGVADGPARHSVNYSPRGRHAPPSGHEFRAPAMRNRGWPRPRWPSGNLTPPTTAEAPPAPQVPTCSSADDILSKRPDMDADGSGDGRPGSDSGLVIRGSELPDGEEEAEEASKPALFQQSTTTTGSTSSQEKSLTDETVEVSVLEDRVSNGQGDSGESSSFIAPARGDTGCHLDSLQSLPSDQVQMFEPFVPQPLSSGPSSYFSPDFDLCPAPGVPIAPCSANCQFGQTWPATRDAGCDLCHGWSGLDPQQTHRPAALPPAPMGQHVFAFAQGQGPGELHSFDGYLAPFPVARHVWGPAIAAGYPPLSSVDAVPYAESAQADSLADLDETAPCSQGLQLPQVQRNASPAPSTRSSPAVVTGVAQHDLMSPNADGPDGASDWLERISQMKPAMQFSSEVLWSSHYED